MDEITPDEARLYWKALLDNASSLIVDANLLLSAGSHGRARSLTVLAFEELGKALWIYDVFAQAWSGGVHTPRDVPRLAQHGTNHTQKYLQTTTFGDELAAFWGDYSNYQQPNEGETWDDFFIRQNAASLADAKTANKQKQAGFYVDRAADGRILSPTAIDPAGIDEQLSTAAQVVEMLLIKDHTRMKHDSSEPYDSTHAEQFRLLPVSHPEEFADWLESTPGDTLADAEADPPRETAD